jgi:hypothetical protein
MAASGLMPYDTQDMSLATGFINGVKKGFTVNCQIFVGFGELFVPALQRKIELKVQNSLSQTENIRMICI